MSNYADNFSSWKRLLLISLGVSKPMSMKDIAKSIKDYETNSFFRKDVNFLVENGLADVDKERFPFLYTINNKKLNLYLRSCYPFELAGQLIEATTLAHHY